MLATKSLQTKVKFHMNALEEQVKNGNLFLNQPNRLFDSILINSFMENHYKFMVHHLLALKIQLERCCNPGEEMEEKLLIDEVAYKKEQRRPEEHKKRVKALRSSKSESLKYVLQWENLMDDQKTDKIINTVRMRTKDDKNRLYEIPEDEGSVEDVSKTMVTKRVQLFEGYKKLKPKRVSSTMEAFLESTYEKTKSCSMLENLEEEDESVRDSKRLSEGLLNYEASFNQNLLKTTDQLENTEKVISVTENQDIKSSEIELAESLLNHEVASDQTLPKSTDQVVESTQKISFVTKNLKEENVEDSNIQSEALINSNGNITGDFSPTTDKISKQSTQSFRKHYSKSTNLNIDEANQANQLPDYIEIVNSKSNENVCTKPRIVEVHYKLKL